MSNFCDQTIVELIGGNGGNGAVSFRREKHVPRGGPDGGDGGNGGNIILIADQNINTLVDYNTKKLYKAVDGNNGHGKYSSGKMGEDLILKMPLGTKVIDHNTNELLVDLKTHGQKFIAATGGKGGLGNSNFKSSIHQAPKFAELGEEGEQKMVLLELQLVADVGIIGFPSAGKSTLISRISNAKPKIADYPFTTLIPNLGVVDMKKYDKNEKSSFVVADIPGLIEGAHKGKGLGHTFLRHVSRTEVLVHLIDPTRCSVEDFSIINAELDAYDKRLSSKNQIIVISKTDTQTPDELKDFIKKLKKKNPKIKSHIHVISSITGEGINEIVFDMYKQITQHKSDQREQLEYDETKILDTSEKVYRPHLREKKFEVKFIRKKIEAATGKERRTFDVTGKRIEQVVKMTDLSNPEGVERIYHFMKKMGINNELISLGAQAGDKIRIGDQTFTMRP